MAKQEKKSSTVFKINRMTRKIKFRGTFIIILALLAGYYYQTETLRFNPDMDFIDVPKLLGYLLLLTLFVERCI